MIIVLYRKITALRTGTLTIYFKYFKIYLNNYIQIFNNKISLTLYIIEIIEY